VSRLKLAVIALFLLVAYAAYVYIRAQVDHARLEQAVNLMFESPQATVPARFQTEFQRSAEALGIQIPAERIHLSLEDTGQTSETGKIIKPSGLFVQSKLLTLDAEYSKTILGIPKWFSIHRRKVFTYRVEQPMTIPDEIPMD